MDAKGLFFCRGGVGGRGSGKAKKFLHGGDAEAMQKPKK